MPLATINGIDINYQRAGRGHRLLYLNGSTLEWEKTLMRQGFKFVNPNEKSNCGCGTSFTV